MKAHTILANLFAIVLFVALLFALPQEHAAMQLIAIVAYALIIGVTFFLDKQTYALVNVMLSAVMLANVSIIFTKVHSLYLIPLAIFLVYIFVSNINTVMAVRKAPTVVIKKPIRQAIKQPVVKKTTKQVRRKGPKKKAATTKKRSAKKTVKKSTKKATTKKKRGRPKKAK
ncbi:MAG: hypothetical protein ACMXYF_04140 [Candidatus Woesearchaeota archaeon]